VGIVLKAKTVPNRLRMVMVQLGPIRRNDVPTVWS
jgi:hypothetical protein